MSKITDPEHLNTFLWYKKYKENCECILCHSKKNIELHHIYPKGDQRCDKYDTVSNMVYTNMPLEDCKDEVSKTLPLCSKCHREYHQKLKM